MAWKSYRQGDSVNITLKVLYEEKKKLNKEQRKKLYYMLKGAELGKSDKNDKSNHK